MNTPKKDSLTNKILLYLKDTSKDLLIGGATIIFEPRKLMKGMGIYRDYNKYPLKYSFHNLKRSSYFNATGDKFYLNSKGRVSIIKQIIKEKKNVKTWDHKWRAVIFDVPEKKRHERNFLRNELKWMGFKELQHSVWITPYDIEKELLCLLKLWHKDFEGNIKFLSVDKIVSDKKLKKKFDVFNERRSSVIVQ